MPHQCVKCSRIIPAGSREILEGCNNCGSKFFFYIREEQLEKVKQNPIKLPDQERKAIEKDVREVAGIEDEDQPVVLDLESVRATGAGKYEIDLVNLFNEEKPLIYKLNEGKYIIDLASKIKNPHSEEDKEEKEKKEKNG